MLLKRYELKKFSNEFSKKTRKPIGEDFTTKQAFKELKLELIDYLKTFDKELDLKLFEELEFFFEGFSLCMRYKETTGQPMTIRFIRRVNDLTPELIKEYIKTFIKEELKGDVMPTITFPRAFGYQNLAIYWPGERIIAISMHTYMQLEEEEVKSILRHEAIHHYLNVKGEPAGDTDDEFIELLLEHDGILSQDPIAVVAVDNFKRRQNKLTQKDITKTEEKTEEKAEVEKETK